MSGAEPPRVALKVDIDTHDGLRVGVPVIRERLAAHGIRASFFVVCGPDTMGRRLHRLLRPRFVMKLIRTRAPSVYGWRTLLSGTLLPARPIAAAFPEMLRALVREGHEVAVHGHDHALWQDRLPALDAAAVVAQVARARAVYREALGAEPHAFAAPGWRCTAASLAAVDDAGFDYRSDTRGTAPYRPAVDGRVFRAPELPTTLPTLDETYGVVGRNPASLADDLVARLRPGTLEVHTIHAELEGGLHADVLDAFLARTVGRVRFVRLCDEAAALDVAALPICEVRDGTLPGRPLPVAVQQPPDAR
ncbi:MAG: polysaccharide deacetylase family protein [Candidatus Binatia bacterium]